MKRTLIASVLCIAASISVTSYGQLSVYFSTYDVSASSCVEQVRWGSLAPPGEAGQLVTDSENFRCNLLWHYGSTNSDAGLAVPTVTIPGYGAGWINGPPVTIPGYTGGPIQFTINIWSGGTNYTDPNNGAVGSVTWQEPGFSVGAGYPQTFNAFPCAVYVNLGCTGAPPVIIQEPTNQTVSQGETATFSISFDPTGKNPIRYQWFLDGTNINGATTSSLVISNAQPFNSGSYFVYAWECGFATSTVATLTVLYRPVIQSQPQAVSAFWGKSAYFEVDAVGLPLSTYQWYKDGISLDSATNYNLTLTPLALANAGNYWAVVSNSQGSVTSNPALLIVNPAGVSIGLHPFLSIQGVTGYTYGIQTTTNVAQSNSWTTLTNLTLSATQEEWIDTNVNAARDPLHFYRVIAAPP
jgi:hypothetical protein